jgi:hypothetical protein
MTRVQFLTAAMAVSVLLHHIWRDENLRAADQVQPTDKLFEPETVQKELKLPSKRTLGLPQWGYSSARGAFEVRAPAPIVGSWLGLFRAQRYPTPEIKFLRAELNYVGEQNVQNRDGWLFRTQFDGTEYPSYFFFSAERESPDDTAYRVYTYRNATSWKDEGLHMRAPVGP